MSSNTTQLPVLRFQHVSKTYGTQKALNKVSLEIHEGEKVALLGCNGAGKSSFINIATGLRRQTDGEVYIYETKPYVLKSKQNVAYLPQTLKFPSYLKVKEIIKLVERHFNSKIDSKILERLELSSLLSRYCSGLSGGEERKLGLALCLIGERPFLILDEPTANVDLIAKAEIHNILLESIKKKNNAFLFSSHEMNEVEKLADRVVVLNQGEVIASGRVKDIKKEFGLMTVHFKLNEVLNLNLDSATQIETESLNSQMNYKVYGISSDDIIKELVLKQVPFKNLFVEETSLDEVFLKLWKRSKK